MGPNLQSLGGLVTLTEEIVNEKLIFLCSELIHFSNKMNQKIQKTWRMFPSWIQEKNSDWMCSIKIAVLKNVAKFTGKKP